MRLGVLFSGGKDSTYAAYLAQKEGNDLVCLINMVSENKASYMFHTPSIGMAHKQAEALGVNIIICDTKGEKEEELKDLEIAIKEAISRYEIEGIVTGALASDYQASRIQKICDDLKIKCLNPLWKRNPDEYWDDLLRDGFKVMIIGVAAQGLEKEWLGKEVGREELETLKKLSKKNLFHMGFEGGEAETFVLDCPLFKKSIKILEGEVIWDDKDKAGIYEIKAVELVDK